MKRTAMFLSLVLMWSNCYSLNFKEFVDKYGNRWVQNQNNNGFYRESETNAPLFKEMEIHDDEPVYDYPDSLYGESSLSESSSDSENQLDEQYIKGVQDLKKKAFYLFKSENSDGYNAYLTLARAWSLTEFYTKEKISRESLIDLTMKNVKAPKNQMAKIRSQITDVVNESEKLKNSKACLSYCEITFAPYVIQEEINKFFRYQCLIGEGDISYEEDFQFLEFEMKAGKKEKKKEKLKAKKRKAKMIVSSITTIMGSVFILMPLPPVKTAGVALIGKGAGDLIDVFTSYMGDPSYKKKSKVKK